MRGMVVGDGGRSSGVLLYTIVMGDFNAKVGGQTNTSERATGCFGLGQRNEITCCNLVLFQLLYYNVRN